MQVYSNSPGMRLHVNNTPHLVEAAKALNVLYVCSNTYESYLIYWLYPLQLAFPSDSGQGKYWLYPLQLAFPSDSGQGKFWLYPLQLAFPSDSGQGKYWLYPLLALPPTACIPLRLRAG